MSDLQQAAKNAVVVYFNTKNNLHELTEQEVRLEAFDQIESNWKATASTTIADGMCYELVYIDERNELTVTAFTKFDTMVLRPKKE